MLDGKEKVKGKNFPSDIKSDFCLGVQHSMGSGVLEVLKTC